MKPETKTKIKAAAKIAAKYARAFIITLVSAPVVVIMYVLYLPFGIGRAVFNRREIRAFYTDFFDVCEIIESRWLKREEEHGA